MNLQHWRPATPPQGIRGNEQPLAAAAAELLSAHGTVLGIDAGGTGSNAVLIVNGAAERHYSGPPLNALLHADAGERIRELLLAHRAEGAGIGLPGSGRDGALRSQLATQLEATTGSRIRIASDAVTAWLSAFLGSPGIAVVAGTGSVAVGGRRPPLRQIGGYGYLLGDEGGGYWIGRQGLRAALAAADGSGPATVLSADLPAAASCSLDQLMTQVYCDPHDRLLLAQLAPVVAASADLGHDTVAACILDSAADALVQLASVLTRELGDLPVTGIGGIFQINRIWDRFADLTDAQRPAVSPEIGAALLVTSRWCT